MNEVFLQHMYQSWMQGNNNYIRDWYKFVNLVSKHFSMDYDSVLEVLEKYQWFKKGEK